MENRNQRLLHEEIGRKVTQKRDELGLSQEQLARALGVSPSLMSKIESGKRSCSVFFLHDLARELSTSWEWLGSMPSRPRKTEAA